MNSRLRNARRVLAAVGVASAVAIFGVATASTATGCFLGCTAIGCESAIRVTIDDVPVGAKLSIEITGADRTIHASADAATASCEVDDADPGSCFMQEDNLELELFLDQDFDDEDTVLTVKVVSDTGTTLLDVSRTTVITESSPNGAFCGPTCYNGDEKFDL